MIRSTALIVFIGFVWYGIHYIASIVLLCVRVSWCNLFTVNGITCVDKTISIIFVLNCNISAYKDKLVIFLSWDVSGVSPYNLKQLNITSFKQALSKA